MKVEVEEESPESGGVHGVVGPRTGVEERVGGEGEK
jgi:hypothetical protein